MGFSYFFINSNEFLERIGEGATDNLLDFFRGHIGFPFIGSEMVWGRLNKIVEKLFWGIILLNYNCL